MCIRHAKQECIIFQFDEKLNMQYILSEEEYKSLIPIKEYERMRSKLLEENARLENIINSLKNEILKDRECPDKDGEQILNNNTIALPLCDGCVLGFEGLDVCKSSKKYYSK